MPELLTGAAFEQRIHQLSDRLEALKPARPAHAHLPFANVDLSEVAPELASVLAALLQQDADEPLTTNPRLQVTARRLALTALLSLLQSGSGLADLAPRFKRLVGLDLDYAQLEPFLSAAMREAGLPVPPRADARRLVEHLLALAGLPASLREPLVRYFATYWLWFHPQEQVLTPLRKPEAHTDKALAAELAGYAEQLLPNAAIVGPAIESLVRVMLYLRTQPSWRVGDLFAQAEAVREGCGVNPRALLGDDEAMLAILVERLNHAWHPVQFRHLLTALPRGGEVRMPNGSLSMAERAVAIPYWGVYQIEGKRYLVLPNEGLTLEAVTALPEGQLWTQGNRAVWRGPDEAFAEADGWPQLLGPRHLYADRQSQGWFYFELPPNARTLRIGKDTLAPRAGVHWRTALLASLDNGAPRLQLRVDGLRVCLPELAEATLQLECPRAETAGRLTFDLDAQGIGGLPDLVLALTAPNAGTLEMYLQDHARGAVITHEDAPVVRQIPLPEVMLFFEATGQPVAPSERPYPYGLPSMLLFAARPINTDALELLDVGVESLGTVGAFGVYRLSWRQTEQALTIAIDTVHTWSFSYRVETSWQPGALPVATAPLAFDAEPPGGYVVASVDELFVDDVSLVENPLVTIARDGQVVAAHTWAELNWMMNFPTDNRRFSGLMLRRALHQNPEFDLAGRYQLALRAGGEVLGERAITVLPNLAITTSPQGVQGEETRYTLSARCAHPCFAGERRDLTVDLGSVVVDRDTMENSPFQPHALEATLPLSVPLFDLRVAIVPEVVGFRLLDENEGSWIRKTMLSYEELGHITLVLFGANAQSGSLAIAGGETLTEEFYEGFATFSLASLQETLASHETEVNVAVDGRDVGTLTVTWHPQVLQFEAANEYLVDGAAHLTMQVTGPADTPVVLEAFSPDGRKLGRQEIASSDGAAQSVVFPLPASRDYPEVTVRAFVPTEATGIAAGSVEIRNAAFDPEIEAINRRIADQPHEAGLRYERAQMLLARGLRKAAQRDFASAIELGMTELQDSPQYQQFMSQRRAESFKEDVRALSSFFVPFARKELNIG